MNRIAISALAAVLLAAGAAHATRIDLAGGALVVDAVTYSTPAVDVRVTSNALPLDVRSFQACNVSADPGWCGGFTNAEAASAFVGIHPGCVPVSVEDRAARCEVRIYPGPGSGVYVAPELGNTNDGETLPVGVCYFASISEWQCTFLGFGEDDGATCAALVYWGSRTGGVTTTQPLACVTP